MNKSLAFLSGFLFAVLVFIIVALLPSCARADNSWTYENTAMEIGYNALALIDMRTTMDIRKHDNIEEVGPARVVLGRNPEVLPTVAYFAATSVAHYAISRTLPRGWREGWQVVTIGVEGSFALNNVRLGLNWTW